MPSNPTAPGLGHGRLLGGEPGRRWKLPLATDRGTPTPWQATKMPTMSQASQVERLPMVSPRLLGRPGTARRELSQVLPSRDRYELRSEHIPARVSEHIPARVGTPPLKCQDTSATDHSDSWWSLSQPLMALHWPRHGRWTSGNVALLSALAAFAVPAAFGVAQPLPTVPADATQPGLGHRGLLVGEPFRLGQGHPDSPAAGEHPAAAARLPRP